ncbi:MAG: DUF3575 domain-containing protein [Rikenellaceae bacterium]|nr:DUF3575 domain-containing protein [Rikenellaceae bacterium]
MKKTLICLLLSLFIVTAATSQTYIKFNALYWLAGITNVSVETKLGNHFTYNNDLIASPWKSVSGNPMMFAEFIPELRYYPNEAFRGFYAGAYATSHVFKMCKWNYWNTNYYQKGWGFGAGLNLGYEVPINDRWLLDVYASGGWQVSRYRGFLKSDGSQHLKLNNSGEWLPYRIGITFAYKLGTGKVNH